MERAPEPQDQPVYPQQYPQQSQQPYPYYYPYPPPPKKDDNKWIIIVVVVIVVFLVLPFILSLVLYLVVIDLAPNGSYEVPTGVWGQKTVISSTEFRVDFGRVNPEPRPNELEIMLIRNGTEDAIYMFSSNDDGILTLRAGMNLGTLTYADLADNQRINTGDSISLTGLMPGSDYSIRMIWAATGDMITSTTFATPG